jgi:octopine/nopaline transport system substrate-binding protein
MATDTCMGLRKGEDDLKAKLDPAIQSMIADGTMKTLSEKWFKFDVSPK